MAHCNYKSKFQIQINLSYKACCFEKMKKIKNWKQAYDKVIHQKTNSYPNVINWKIVVKQH